jgi:hypothetical protein
MRVLGLFVFLTAVYFYTKMPVLALGFTDWSTPLALWGLLLLLLPLMTMFKRFQTFLAGTVWGDILKKLLPEIFRENDKVVDITNHQKYGWLFKRYKILVTAGAVMLGIGMANSVILPLLTSTPLFFSQSYRNLLGEVRESSFTADVEPINLAQIRIVDEETARKLADKTIGEVPALGSEVQLGEMALQKVKGKLYYVAPLEHRGVFQWLSNYSRGSKGFVMVSATNPQDVHLVQNTGGHDVYIKYQTRGFIFDYLPRYLYFHGVVNAGMADFSFEIDDELNPYWVVTLYRNKVGYGGSDAVGVVLVNAATGQISRYGLDNVPSWVDRVQPAAFIYNQIKNWGEYVNGYWNTVFARTGTLKPTDREMHLIYGNDDRVYWYTGISSLGKDESTVGFLLVDSRTKEAKWYKVAGANETSARQSAEGQVQEKGYRAGYPVLYNISGIPTYIAPLKDKEGLLKAVAFISVENYNLVGVGPDIESAQRAYRQSLTSKGNLIVPQNAVSQLSVEGRISRITQVVRGGESYFYLMLENDPRIFVGPAGISSKLPLARTGDKVTLMIHETTETTVGINEFKGDSY